MKFVAMIEYGSDREKTKELHPKHREYLRGLLDSDILLAAGPFIDDGGALWIVDATTVQEAEDLVRADPYVDAGVIVKWQIQPLAYWSAREAKGSR